MSKDDRGTYICKAENFLGTVADTAQLIVFSRLRFKVRPPQEITPFMFGLSVPLPCFVESDLRLSVTWSKDGNFSLPTGAKVLRNNTLFIQSLKQSHIGSYTCRATNALTTIEAKVKINFAANANSCSGIRKYVSSVSGNYVIDPDGAGGLDPFTVYCNMTDKNGVGVTVVSHDSESRTYVKGYKEPGSYSRDIHYIGASLSQLASLTRISSHCEQFIKYECYQSIIGFNSGGYAWWASRDSKKMLYWGGAPPGSGKCACGMTKSCGDNGGDRCNCDQGDGNWRADSGFLTEKSHLPVKQLRFGDTATRKIGTNYGLGYYIEKAKGYHTLGKLKCYGTVN